MDVPPEFQSTLATLTEVIAPYEKVIMRNGLLVQACRVIDGSHVSRVSIPEIDRPGMDALNLKMERFIEDGRGGFGCAIGIVPDGPDVYVVIAGAMSDGALTLLAETIANEAAVRFTGASMV